MLRGLKSTFQDKQNALAEELSALRAAEQAIRAEATLAESEGKRWVSSRKLSSLVLHRVNIFGGYLKSDHPVVSALLSLTSTLYL
jgi:hypothetical protein